MCTSTLTNPIRFMPYGITINVPAHDTILKAANKAGLPIDVPCGGNGTCGKCLVDVHFEHGIERKKACSTYVTQPMTVTFLSDNQSLDILTDTKYDKHLDIPKPFPVPGVSPGFLAACDIGSTTIVLYLLDSSSGTCLATSSALNPQTSYSADVIGRIAYAMEHSPQPLTDDVRKTVASLIYTACTSVGIQPEQITHLCLVGNCCMHHLFFGFPTDSLAVIPYEPSVLDALVRPAKEYDLPMHPDGVVQSLPNIAGFVGADTAACMSAVSFDAIDEMTLLLDIGTNGELVLGNKDRRITCSTAAGPALEGAKISCGMRGSKGAIDHIWLENGNIAYSVIGQDHNSNLTPSGLCGSGLIDAISIFLTCGIIDETGRFTEPKTWPDISSFCLKENLPAFRFSENVWITQKDIREIQLAKAAIAAGIQLMCEILSISVSDIKKVLIAGAFGNYMNPLNACKIGLLPMELSDRIIPIGNAAGAGACRCVLSVAEFQKIQTLAKETQFLELASLTDFQDVFIDNLDFF